jgi:hypothetical protein
LLITRFLRLKWRSRRTVDEIHVERLFQNMMNRHRAPRIIPKAILQSLRFALGAAEVEMLGRPEK